jgi:hypothetical protein
MYDRFLKHDVITSYLTCRLGFKTNTLTILKHQMRIWTTQVHSVMLRSKKLEIRGKNAKTERDWLIDYLRFYVPLKNFSLIWRRHYSPWRAAQFKPMLGAQGLWAGRDLYRDTSAVTRDLGFSGLIRRTAPFSRLLRHTRGCGGYILTRILTGRKLKEPSTERAVRWKPNRLPWNWAKSLEG